MNGFKIGVMPFWDSLARYLDKSIDNHLMAVTEVKCGECRKYVALPLKSEDSSQKIQ